MNYAKNSNVSKKQTPQTSPIPGREMEMKQNNAGGFSFSVDNLSTLKRFLILGSEGGTYYVGEQKLTEENSKNAIMAIKTDGVAAVKLAKEISDAGRAKSNDPAIFLLALAFTYGDIETKREAERSFNSIVRIGTHLFHFVDYVNHMNGWNTMLRRTVANWYLSRDPENLEFQMIKYQQRDGWSHHDVLHLCHAKPQNAVQDLLFGWAKNKELKYQGEDREIHGKYLKGYLKCHDPSSTLKDVISAIKECNLTAEMIPTQYMKDVEVWKALLPNLGYTALVRNLGRLSSLDLLKVFSDDLEDVINVLSNEDKIKKSRIHPLTILNAMKIYSQGRGDKGSLSWTVNQDIVATLERAFEIAFVNVESSGKNVLLALDVSASMCSPNIAGTRISPREASAVMAMITARKEKSCAIVGFSHRMVDLGITKKDSYRDVLQKISGLPFGGTDCALPMLWAMENDISNVDAFVTYTDCETWCGTIHPMQALKKYRDLHNASAKSIVVGMTATDFSIADPKDPGSLDVVGFDSAAPAMISDFIAGRI
jgi:60 kDa SS-A/Ro ribonucleoprotein